MKEVRIACKFCTVLLVMLMCASTNVFASLTKEQAEDVASFATTFIEKGNERRDENGYPLLVYALSGNYNTSVEIRRKGYFAELYDIKKNNYHMKNGKYLELGPKWCMDCGDFISYVYKTTLGLDMYLEKAQDPWHIKDMYADANKGDKSEIFEFVYKNVPISSINEEKLEKGDVVIRIGSRENHGLIYVGEEMQAAHASRNAIKYSKNPPILGFEVVQFDRFYKKSTIISIIRVKDGIVDTNQKVNSTITWPDTVEEVTLLKSEDEIVEEELDEIVEIHILYGTDKVIENEENFNINALYLEQIMNLSQDEDYIRNHIYDWIIYEFKKFLMGFIK